MLLPVVNPSKYILTLRTKLRLTPIEVDQILRNFAPYFPERASRNVELRSHTMESSTRPSERASSRIRIRSALEEQPCQFRMMSHTLCTRLSICVDVKARKPSSRIE